MSTVSLASLAVSTQRRGYCTDKLAGHSVSLDRQGDAGWGVSTSDRWMQPGTKSRRD